jgi:hypothetical protein
MVPHHWPLPIHDEASGRHRVRIRRAWDLRQDDEAGHHARLLEDLPGGRMQIHPEDPERRPTREMADVPRCATALPSVPTSAADRLR